MWLHNKYNVHHRLSTQQHQNSKLAKIIITFVEEVYIGTGCRKKYFYSNWLSFWSTEFEHNSNIITSVDAISTTTLTTKYIYKPSRPYTREIIIR